jgi:hypothetical protein
MLTRRSSEMLAQQAIASFAAAQTIKFQVVRQPKRLVGFFIQLAVTLTTAPSATASGMAALLKRIRVRVNDMATGLRNAVDCTGPALFLWNRFAGLAIDRKTQHGVVSKAAALTDATAYTITLFVPCVDPRLGERAIPLMSIPLSTLKEDCWLEIDLGIPGDVGTSGAISGTGTIDCRPIYRNDGLDTLYIPSELKTDELVWAATGQQTYLFPDGDFLTGFQVENFQSAVIRGASLNGTARYQFRVGDDYMETFTDALMIADNDRCASSPIFPIPAITAPTSIYDTVDEIKLALSWGNFPNTWVHDLLRDAQTQEAWGINSVIPLLTPANNQRARLIFNDIANTAYYNHLTYHKLRPKVTTDLQALASGV